MLNADKNNKTTRINHKSTRNQTDHFSSTQKKIKIYQIRTFTVLIVLENHFKTIQIIQETNHFITPTIEADHEIKKKFSQNRYSRSNSRNNQYRNNYSRSNSNRPEYSSNTSSYSHSRNSRYFNDRSRNSSSKRHRNYSNNRNRSYSNNQNQRYQKKNHEIIQTTDQIIKDLTTTIIKKDHKITHKIGTQTITIDKETTLNYLIEIIHIIPILKTNIEAHTKTSKTNKSSTNN